MKIHEYQAKEIFKEFGIATPAGRVASTPDEAEAVAAEVGGPVAVKAQVHVGGRGKAGGIKVAKTPAEAKEAAGKILGMDIKGLTVEKVLVEKASNIGKEYYLGFVNDRGAKAVTRVASEVLSALRKYSFPGNVRELENAIEHAIVMCDGEEIRAEHLPEQIVAESETTNGFLLDHLSEREVIEEALRRHHGNRSRVAEELGMHRSTLWRKLKTYGIAE